MQISIIIPIYNEEDNIKLLQKELDAVLIPMDLEYEIIYVNDSSADSSKLILDEIAKTNNRVKVLHFAYNSGQTSAMMAGINYSTGEILIPMDGDLQNDPKDIPRLIDKLNEGYDVVSGWRKDRQDKAFTRKLPSLIANWCISKISGVHLHDYGCTLKAYRNYVIKDVRLYGEMHRFIPIYSSWLGAKICELAVNHRARTFGISKYGLSRIFKVILDMVLIRFFHIALDRPIHFFGKIGLYSLFGAFLSGTTALVLKIFYGLSFILTPLPLLTVFLALSGIGCILLGLIAELQMRIYFESQNKLPYLIKSTKNI